MSEQSVALRGDSESVDGAELVEQVVVKGDLSKLTPEDRAKYYRAVCTSLGVNPLTRPFDYLMLNGKLVLYANRVCGDQLRRIRGVSVHKIEREITDGMCIVTAYARDRDGREDSDMGIVTVKNLAGDPLANAMLKAVTKAKRRVTLSLCGLGWLDESEVETIPGAQRIAAQEVEGAPEAAPASEGQPPDAATIINSDQRMELLKWCDDRGIAIEALLKPFGVTDAAELTDAQYVMLLQKRDMLAKQEGATPAELVSKPQVSRLFTLARKGGWNDTEIRDLIGSFGYQHSTDILRRDYEKIINVILNPDAPRETV
jgi:hypothetical protein